MKKLLLLILLLSVGFSQVSLVWYNNGNNITIAYTSYAPIYGFQMNVAGSNIVSATSSGSVGFAGSTLLGFYFNPLLPNRGILCEITVEDFDELCMEDVIICGYQGSQLTVYRLSGCLDG